MDNIINVFNLRPFRFNPNFTTPNLGWVMNFLAVKKKTNPIPIKINGRNLYRGLGKRELRVIPIPIPKTNIPK